MKLGIFPLTCDKYEDRRSAILDTWAKGHPHEVIFLGDRELHTGPDNRVLQLNCMDPVSSHPALTDNPYEDAPHKLFNAFRSLSESEFTWLFFCDDDTYVKVHLLQEYVESVRQKFGDNAGGVWGLSMKNGYEHDRDLDYPSGGAGYLTNVSTLRHLVPYLDGAKKTEPDAWGDVMLGFALRDAGVPIINDNVFYDLDSEMEWKEWQWSRGKHNRTPSITYHYMTPEKMRLFYDQHHKNVPVWYQQSLPHDTGAR
jgi:hypothetical protein